MNRLLLATVAVAALSACGCAPAGHVYEAGNFVRPHPTQELCASRGQVLDMKIEDCVTPPPPQPPTPAQAAQAQRANAVTSERDACIKTAGEKFRRGAEGQTAGYQIWLAENQACEDVMLSRLTALKLNELGGNCSLKLDWMARYRQMVTTINQQAMAEQRYAENCSGRRS